MKYMTTQKLSSIIMKRVIYLLATLAITILTACQKEIGPATNPATGEGNEIVFTASLGEISKAYIDTNVPKFAEGDQITVYAFDTAKSYVGGESIYSAGYDKSLNPKYTSTALSDVEAGESTATFHFNKSGWSELMTSHMESPTTTVYIAYYPTNLFTFGGTPKPDKATMTGETSKANIIVALPGGNGLTNQTNSNIQSGIAYSNNRNLAFKNVWHLIRFSPNCPEAATAVLTALDGSPVSKMQTRFYFDSSTGDISSATPHTGDVLSLTHDMVDGVNYFALSPGITMSSGFKIELKNGSGDVLKTFIHPDSFTTVRNMITTIGNFDLPVLKNGTTFNAAVKTLIKGSTAYSTDKIIINDIQVVTRDSGSYSESSTCKKVSADGSSCDIWATYDSGSKTLTLRTSAGMIAAPVNSSYLFYQLEAKACDGSFLNKISLNNVTNASYMLDDCLTNPDLPTDATISGLTLNLPEATNVISMLGQCKRIVTVTVNIPMVTRDGVRSLFYNCANMTGATLYGVGNNTITSTQSMFSGCSKLVSIDGDAITTSLIDNTSMMFLNCGALTSVDISHITGTPTNISYMFSGCNHLSSIVFSDDFDTFNVSEYSNLFSTAYRLNYIVMKGLHINKSLIADNTSSKISAVFTNITRTDWGSPASCTVYYSALPDGTYTTDNCWSADILDDKSTSCNITWNTGLPE